MDISVYTVPPLGTNCYFLSDGTHLGIIDPGGAAKELIAEIEKINLLPFGIYLTHGHFDHTGAAGALKAYFDIPVFIHKEDAPMLLNADTSHASRFGFSYAGCVADQCFDEGDTLTMGTLSLSVFHTPGHTKGSSVFRTENILFTGDTLFAGSIGNFPPEGASDMRQSLARLLRFPDELLIYPGHNAPSDIGTEKRTNPFVWEMN